MGNEEKFYSNIKIAYKLAYRYYRCDVGVELDDLIQLAMMFLWKATINFKEELNLRFSTIAYKYIYNGINTYLKRNRKHNNLLYLEDTIYENLSLKDILTEQDDEIDKLIDRIDNQDEVKEIFEIIKHTRDKNNTNIYIYISRGLNQNQIAIKMKKSRQAINRKLKRMNKKVISDTYRILESGMK